jgi:phosphosulfolactate synthase
MTMVVDIGMPITEMRDTLQMASEHIDFWKFGFASASVCPPERILDKIMLCGEYEVQAYPGGTSLEIAYSQGVWQEYLTALMSSGLRTVEVSDSEIELPVKKRREIIRNAKRMGFTVLSEVGAKQMGSRARPSEMAQLIQGDITAGASYVVIQGREGVYDVTGAPIQSEVEQLVNLVGLYSTRIIWNAALPKQQSYFLEKYGLQANLGNVPIRDVISLECLRRGLRSEDEFEPTVVTPFAENDAMSEKIFSQVADALLQNTAEETTGPTLWTSRTVNLDRLKKKGL